MYVYIHGPMCVCVFVLAVRAGVCVPVGMAARTGSAWRVYVCVQCVAVKWHCTSADVARAHGGVHVGTERGGSNTQHFTSTEPTQLTVFATGSATGSGCRTTVTGRRPLPLPLTPVASQHCHSGTPRRPLAPLPLAATVPMPPTIIVVPCIGPGSAGGCMKPPAGTASAAYFARCCRTSHSTCRRRRSAASACSRALPAASSCWCAALPPTPCRRTGDLDAGAPLPLPLPLPRAARRMWPCCLAARLRWRRLRRFLACAAALLGPLCVPPVAGGSPVPQVPVSESSRSGGV